MKYLLYILRHKWRMRRYPLHDLSKLLPDEFWPYRRRFYGDGTPCPAAIQRHYRRNKHHWQHWHGRPMPERYVREMVADWMAMGDAPGYMRRNYQRIHLHPQTWLNVDALLWPGWWRMRDGQQARTLSRTPRRIQMQLDCGRTVTMTDAELWRKRC